MSPVSRRESARGENSIVNAFKAIEAVIGDPPKDEAKFKRKLQGASIDPNELCGLGPRRETIGIKICKMNDMRDKKAAHGRTGGDRQITYFDIMDCQACARLVLLKQFQNCFKPRKDGLQWWQTP